MNMKKQFFRVKQLADQTFLRADKSEVLNYEELQIADQRVDYLRNAVSAIVKRLPSGGQGNDIDKRIKKCLEYHLAQVMAEQGGKKGEHGSIQEEECRLFQQIVRECGDVENDLAREYAEHEKKIEEIVTAPLQSVLDAEFHSIMKHKRILYKYILDKDSASNRYHSTKKEALKGDMENADTKVEQNRDALASEMFGLLANENTFSTYILQLLKLQRGYHESALTILKEIIPKLEQKIGDSPVRKVFGAPLREHLRVQRKRIAFPLEICITSLLKFGMLEEGLLRIGGSQSKAKRLQSSIDSGCLVHLIPEYRDVHVLATTLKKYLRDLPEPLLTFKLHNEWLRSVQLPENQRVEAVKKLIMTLPQENRENLSYLIHFLVKVSKHPENKMNASNIAIVVAPNLLWTEEQKADMNIYAYLNSLVELFIREVDTLFPEDFSHLVSLPPYLLQDEEDEFLHKSITHSGKDGDQNVELSVSTENIHTLDSPKPNSRRKKPAAPVPPNNVLSKTDQDLTSDNITLSASYPSGSSTLNRPQKSKDSPKSKTSVGINTDENLLNLQRRKSLTQEETHKNTDVPKVSPLVNLDTKTVDHKYVTQPAANIQLTKAKPVQPIVAQSTNCDRNFKTTVTHQVYQPNSENSRNSKPVAAPRSLIPDTERSVNVSRSSSMRSDVMSKSASEVLSDIQLRKPEALERVGKPEVPARPASLQKRSSIDSHLDSALHKTQCSVYSVANKQQPSIVNLQNRNEKFQPGHDNQIAEKERFLGHQPEKVSPLPKTSIENKTGDINSNCSANVNKPGLPPKAQAKTTEKSDLAMSNERLDDITKSAEKLNVNTETVNGNRNQRPSHIRTRSDGNLIDITSGGGTLPSLMHTPPSPRSLNKPTQPPPPPPVNIKAKEPDSTDL